MIIKNGSILIDNEWKLYITGYISNRYVSIPYYTGISWEGRSGYILGQDFLYKYNMYTDIFT